MAPSTPVRLVDEDGDVAIVIAKRDGYGIWHRRYRGLCGDALPLTPTCGNPAYMDGRWWSRERVRPGPRRAVDTGPCAAG